MSSAQVTQLGNSYFVTLELRAARPNLSSFVCQVRFYCIAMTGSCFKSLDDEFLVAYLSSAANLKKNQPKTICIVAQNAATQSSEGHPFFRSVVN